MQNDVIKDLKQFVSATVSQTITLAFDEQNNRLDKKFAAVEDRFEIIENKITDLSASVAEAIDVTHSHFEQQFQNHENRIRTLESKQI